MPDKHVTDEEIHLLGGASEQRLPAGVPRATCLRCGAEHVAFYTNQAHDCHIDLKKKATYAAWCEDMRRWGFGVLASPAAALFPFDKVITGRTCLTFHLQSELEIHGYELQPGYYRAQEWADAGFVLPEKS